MLNWKILPISIAMVGLAACGQDVTNEAIEADVNDAMLSGVVTYRERIALPENATLTVTLRDMTVLLNDEAAIMSQQEAVLTTPPPWTFELPYNMQSLNESGDYTLETRVTVADKIRFSDTTRITADMKEPLEILLKSAKKSGADNQNILQKNAWSLIELNGEPIPETDAKDINKLIGLSFNEQSNIVEGYAGCNSFSMGYQLSDTKLSFVSGPMTLMACADNKIEDTFIAALTMVSAYKIKGTFLVLLNDNNDALAMFEIAPVNNLSMLQAHTWSLVEMNGEAISLEKSHLSKAIDITFDNTAQNAEGFSGCNQFSMGYELSDTNLSFTQPGISTMSMCEAGDIETYFLSTLIETASYQVDGSSLTLLNNEAAVLATFKIAPKA